VIGSGGGGNFGVQVTNGGTVILGERNELYGIRWTQGRWCDQTSLRGRLGLRAGLHFGLDDGRAIEPYIKASAIHEFLTGDRVTTDQSGFHPTLSGTIADVAAGIATKLSQSAYLYAEYDYATGDKIRQPWAIDLGLRWQW
jgi:outer membrane autotransporter protein